MYIYRAKCVRVVDGDTVDLIIDLGFRMTTYQRIRLLGVDTPELNDTDVSKREEAKEARDRVRELLVDGMNDEAVLQKLDKGAARTYPLIIESEKADSFGRWLARIRYPLPTGGWASLADTLIDEELAVVYSR